MRLQPPHRGQGRTVTSTLVFRVTDEILRSGRTAPVAEESLDGVGSLRFDVKPVTDSFCQFLKLACYSIPPETRLWSGSTLC